MQTLAALVIALLGWFLEISVLEWMAVIFAIFLVLIVELINSAVERITDVLKPRINGYVKEIKDIMAGAVMVASITAVVVGCIIFIPRLLNFLSTV